MIYPYGIGPETTADGRTIYVARSTCLKGCMAQGDTVREALAELEENEKDWLEAAREFGLPIPEAPQ